MVGDLVRYKSLQELKKLGIDTRNPAGIPYRDDIGIVVSVTDRRDGKNHALVIWQKCNIESSCFFEILDIIGKFPG